MTLRLAVALALAVGLGWGLGRLARQEAGPPPLRGAIEDIYRRHDSLFVVVRGTEYAIPRAWDGCWRHHSDSSVTLDGRRKGAKLGARKGAP